MFGRIVVSFVLIWLGFRIVQAANLIRTNASIESAIVANPQPLQAKLNPGE